MSEARFDYVADRLMWLFCGVGIASYRGLDFVDRLVVLMLFLCCVIGAALDLMNTRKFSKEHPTHD